MAYNHWEKIFSAISWFKIPLVSRAELDFLALQFIELQFDMLLLIICQSWILIQSVHIYLCTMTNVYKVTTTRRRKSMVHITYYLNYMFVLQQFWSWYIFMILLFAWRTTSRKVSCVWWRMLDPDAGMLGRWPHEAPPTGKCAKEAAGSTVHLQENPGSQSQDTAAEQAADQTDSLQRI